MLIASAGRTAAAAHTAFPAFSASVAPAGVMAAAAAAARGGAARLPRLVVRQRRHSSSNKHSSRAKQQQPPVATAAPEQGKAAGESTPAPSTTNNKRGTRAAKKTGTQHQQPQQQQTAAKDKDASSKQDATASPPSQTEHRQQRQHASKAADAGHEDAQVPFDAGVNPPSVPPTAHFDHKVIYLARLFAQHRPISLNQPLPPHDGKAAFDSIFEPPSARKRAQDVMFTLASAVKSLESAGASANNNSVKVVTPSPFDEAESFPQSPAINLEELQRSFRPFNAPPAPVPLDPKYMTQAQQQQQQQLSVTQPSSSKRKKKAIVVPTAETDSPVAAVEMPVEETAASAAAAEMAEAETSARTRIVLPPANTVPTLAPTATALFRERMRLRYGSWLVSWIRRMRDQAMQLISVKRQRKLKMKKHKYKKLRKRTRNLRRRQDRL